MPWASPDLDLWKDPAGPVLVDPKQDKIKAQGSTLPWALCFAPNFWHNPPGLGGGMGRKMAPCLRKSNVLSGPTAQRLWPI